MWYQTRSGPTPAANEATFPAPTQTSRCLDPAGGAARRDQDRSFVVRIVDGRGFIRAMDGDTGQEVKDLVPRSAEARRQPRRSSMSDVAPARSEVQHPGPLAGTEYFVDTPRIRELRDRLARTAHCGREVTAPDRSAFDQHGSKYGLASAPRLSALPPGGHRARRRRCATRRSGPNWPEAAGRIRW